MKLEECKIGTRVSWPDSALNLRTGKRHEWIETGTIYRIDKRRCSPIGVLPDSWAKEGLRQGLMRGPNQLTLAPNE